MHLKQADISTAFLYGDLPETETVYMHCPPDIKHKSGQVMRLNRCLYGLKQASRRFFEKLRGILIKAGYTPTKSDPCLYRRIHRGRETLIAVVVDDLLIASDSKKDADRVIQSLRRAGLDTKDLGFPEYVIGLHVKRHKNGDISLSQKLYIETILRRFEMEHVKTCPTPANPTVKLSKKLEANTEQEKVSMQGRPYRQRQRQLVGALMCVILTRPDCAVTVNELSRFCNNPGPTMWTAAKRVLRYLKGTLHLGLCLRRKGRRKLKSLVDSSHADDPDERRSRCGHVILYNGSPICWRTMHHAEAESLVDSRSRVPRSSVRNQGHHLVAVTPTGTGSQATLGNDPKRGQLRMHQDD